MVSYHSENFSKLFFNSLDLLVQLEGLSNKVYFDTASKKTIGVGHLLTPDELLTSKIKIRGKHIDYSLGLTTKQCMDLCMQDLDRYCEAVDSIIKVDLNENQFDALVIFCFNIGIMAFRESTLAKLLNQGDYDSVPEQLMRWTKAGGKDSKGLINRRNAEIKLWNS